MENNEILTKSMIYDLFKEMTKENITLLYQGDFSQNLMKAILGLTEKKMDNIEVSTNVKKKVFNVLVECVQNISKHSDESKEPPASKFTSILMLGSVNDQFIISTGNLIENKKVESFKSKILMINSLTSEGLKNLYKKIIVGHSLDEKGGIGLGLVHIARKTGEKFEYRFDKIDEQYSYFTLKVNISKIK
ncbi:MAG: SiaB family protein kinase [Bacteroidota bacterium]|nr:SiaB family protein kinase [Bacteroidota bacterium]